MAKERPLWVAVAQAVVISLVIWGGFRVFIDLLVNPASCQQGNPSDTGLTNLEGLPGSINPNSSPVQDLLNASNWNLVQTSYDRTLVNLANGTVIGYLQDSAMWKNWTEQNFFIPPSWLPAGPISDLETEFANLRYVAQDSSTGSQALGHVTDFATSIVGMDLGALDYISFNGLTALKTFITTGNTELALCATMPGQIAQLYYAAFDPNVPSQDRANYLGEALAVTSVVGLVSGLSGFSEEFQGTLAVSNLDGAWDTIKPYIEKLGAISPDTANMALVVVQKLATQFPNMGASEAGLVTFRIEGMADVLHQTRDSTTDINAIIQSLGNDVDNGATPDDVANQADAISMEDGHWETVVVGAQQHLYRYTDASTKQYFGTDWLVKNVPGFLPDSENYFKVYYFQDQTFTFNYYGGGATWTATVPPDLGKPGEILTIQVQILTESDFVTSIPKIQFENSAGYRWMPQTAELDSFALNDGQITITGSESPSLEGISSFSFQAQVQGSFEFAPGQGIYLQAGIADIFGQSRSFRIYYSGYGDASIHLRSGAKFPTASMVSFDGVRLSIVYGSPTLAIATTYEASPSGFYGLSDVGPLSLDFQVQGVSQVLGVPQVTLLRQFEANMLASSSNYALGRLGAEIAYSAATEKFGLSDVVIGEPSQGGPDLWTKDGSVVIEARFLGASASADAAGGGGLDQLLQEQLTQMVNHMQATDFAVYPDASVGYAILTYLDADGSLHTIILVVPKG